VPAAGASGIVWDYQLHDVRKRCGLNYSVRTTVELPAELVKDAKARAASRGESLKTLLIGAVAAEVSKTGPPRESASRIKLPLFGDAKVEPVKISREQISRNLVEDDIVAMRRSEQHGV
jgi:hypothetical protein